MVVKTAKKKTAKKTAKRDPTPAALFKKVSAVADSTKALQKELKVMSKIFADNQKVLVSLKDMIDTLTIVLEDMPKQSRQIGILENDTQKLYAGLNQVRSQSNLITKINDQTARLQSEISKIGKLQKMQPGTESIRQEVKDSMNAIRNNSGMIIKIAQRIDEVRDSLRDVSKKADSLDDVSKELENLKTDVELISGKTDKMATDSKVIENLNRELGRISDRIAIASGVAAELDTIKETVNSISDKAAGIDSLGGVLDGLKIQLEDVSARANAAGSNIESLRDMAGKIDKIEAEINSLSHRADSAAFVGEGLKSVQEDLSNFKQNIFEKTGDIEQKISTVSDILKRQDESTSEFHKKSDIIFSELQSVKSTARKSSDDTSKEMMALLKLSESQSAIRMLAESKYGELGDIEKMASQVASSINLFDRISIESGQKIPLPSEVIQWAIGKILDCADRWEIRFGEVYSVLSDLVGRDTLKESIRLKQVRDIYGIRAVDELRRDLGID